MGVNKQWKGGEKPPERGGQGELLGCGDRLSESQVRRSGSGEGQSVPCAGNLRGDQLGMPEGQRDTSWSRNVMNEGMKTKTCRP